MKLSARAADGPRELCCSPASAPRRVARALIVSTALTSAAVASGARPPDSASASASTLANTSLACVASGSTALPHQLRPRRRLRPRRTRVEVDSVSPAPGIQRAPRVCVAWDAGGATRARTRFKARARRVTSRAHTLIVPHWSKLHPQTRVGHMPNARTSTSAGLVSMTATSTLTAITRTVRILVAANRATSATARRAACVPASTAACTAIVSAPRTMCATAISDGLAPTARLTAVATTTQRAVAALVAATSVKTGLRVSSASDVSPAVTGTRPPARAVVVATATITAMRRVGSAT